MTYEILCQCIFLCIQAETSISLLSFYNFEFSQFHSHIYIYIYIYIYVCVWEMHVISVDTQVTGVCKGNV